MTKKQKAKTASPPGEPLLPGEEGTTSDPAPAEAREVKTRGLPLGEVAEEVWDEITDFPLVWRDRSCLMNTWLCFSILTLTIAFFIVPVGALVGLIGSAMYVCRCCRPPRKYAGKKTSKAIYVIALLATVVDLAVAVVVLLLAILYLSRPCDENMSKELCDFPKMVAIAMLSGNVVLMFHLITSFIVFVSMRDCHMEIMRCEHDDPEIQSHRHSRHHSRRRTQSSRV